MFVAAAGGPAWGTYAPPVANVGEIGFVVGLIATALRFARDDAAPTGRAGADRGGVPSAGVEQRGVRPAGTPAPSSRSPRGRS
jgi:hypothetical protein